MLIIKARVKFLWAANFPAIFLPTLCKLFIKIVYTRLEHPYTSECFPDWTHTNYSTNLTSSSTNWPYSFMVRRKWYTYSLWSDSQFVTSPLTKSPNLLFLINYGLINISSPYCKLKPFQLFLSQQCKRFCVLEAVMADCGCFHPLYLDIDGEGARGGIKPCDLGDNTTTLCIETVLNQFTAELRRCPCNQSCYETKYAASVSTSMWPAKQYEVRAFMIHPWHFNMRFSENS